MNKANNKLNISHFKPNGMKSVSKKPDMNKLEFDFESPYCFDKSSDSSMDGRNLEEDDTEINNLPIAIDISKLKSKPDIFNASSAQKDTKSTSPIKRINSQGLGGKQTFSFRGKNAPISSFKQKL
jgi:hypothetical protein